VRFSVRDHRLPGRLEAVWGWEGEMGMGFGVLDSVIIGFVGLLRAENAKLPVVRLHLTVVNGIDRQVVIGIPVNM
jgi:hypothetical protein